MLVSEDMVGHKFGEFAPTRTFHGHAAGQEGEEELIMGKPKRERLLKDNEARAAHAHDPRLAAEAQPRRRADPRQEGGDRACRPRLLAASGSPATSRRRCESAIANAENNHDLDVDALVVAEAHVGKS